MAKDNIIFGAPRFGKALLAENENLKAEVESLRSRVAEMEELSRGCICQSCGEEFREDVHIPDYLWNIIRPEGKPEGAGLLCGKCIGERIAEYNTRLRAALDGVLEHCEICGAIATHATQWSDRDLVYFCDRPECVTKVNGWYDGDHEYDRVGMYTWSLGHEKARAALGGEPASFVLVPRHLLEPFVRIASELEACETSRKMPDSAPLSAPMENIPVVGAYISLGDVRELARIAGGNPSESPIRSEDENESDL